MLTERKAIEVLRGERVEKGGLGDELLCKIASSITVGTVSLGWLRKLFRFRWIF